MVIRVNREVILKDLLTKVKEAKRLNMKEVRIPIKELDDLAFVVYELMTEDVSKILSLKDKKEEPKPKPIKKDSERKVLEEIKPAPVVEKEPEKPVKIKKEEPQFIVNIPKQIEELKPIIQPIQEEQIEEPEEEEDDTENSINGLYGGTW